MVSRQALTSCVAFVLSSGCATSTLGSHEVRVHEYLFGALGGGALDVRDVCGDNAATRLEIRRGAMEYVLSAVTLGIYMPHRLRVECARGRP